MSSNKLPMVISTTCMWSHKQCKINNTDKILVFNIKKKEKVLKQNDNQIASIF